MNVSQHKNSSSASGRVPSSENLVLSMTGVTKRYGGALAIDSVNFDVRVGEIHALLGENGAGKSTLAKIISGATSADSGEVLFDGRPVSFSSPAEASASGVAMVYQETSLVDTMTVSQNLFLGFEKAFNRLTPLNIKARGLLESHNFHIDPSAPVGSLGAAQKQMVEIARAVHRESKLVIFDEPTASVTPEEKQQLFLSMEQLKHEGVGILFITHNLEVMRDGVVQSTQPASELTREKIVHMMVGRDVEYARRPPNRQPDVRPALEIDNLTLGNIVRNMSFSVYPGQIVGIAGLVGAGRTETAMVAFGALKRRRLRGGEIRLDGKPVRFRT
jgi:ABC-type sugar transport system ATPase subunit